MQKMEQLHIYKRSYDFTKWLLNHTNKFPKSHRFSVAVKMENRALEINPDNRNNNIGFRVARSAQSSPMI